MRKKEENKSTKENDHFYIMSGGRPIVQKRLEKVSISSFCGEEITMTTRVLWNYNL